MTTITKHEIHSYIIYTNIYIAVSSINNMSYTRILIKNAKSLVFKSFIKFSYIPMRFIFASICLCRDTILYSILFINYILQPMFIYIFYNLAII